MKIGECFFLNPENNTNKYTDYINYIDTSSVTSGKLENVQYLDSDFPSRANRLIMKNDILYSSVRPNLKHYYFYKDEYPHCVGSTGFIILRKKRDSKINEKFVYYYLSTNTICKHFSNIAELSQTTFPSISAKDIAKIDIPNFTFDQQQKIANILSRYDEAIKNNSKRIKLLEQMAQNLYKEWFVRFRFPGWQNAEFENGMPKGWKIEKLGNLANISTGKCNREDAEENGIYPLFDRSQEIKRSNDWIKDCEAIIVPGEGTTFIPRYYVGKFNLHQRCYCVEPKIEKTGKFLFYTLMMNRLYFLSVATGATVPSLRYNNFSTMKFIMPELSCIQRFDDFVTSCFSQIENLAKANQNLAKQRDLLLPRLMSGKLEV